MSRQAQWFQPTQAKVDEALGPFIEVQAERVRIGQVWLPRLAPPWHPFVPDAQAFAHFCIDQPTAETLAHLALSVSLNEPCLLEGETSTSKTSSVLFLASLLGHPVVRINLNGQTDTGELVGRYVPQHMSADLPVNLQEIVFDIITSGYQPILAHPERYFYFHQNFNMYERLKDLGFMLQVNLLSLTGYYGKTPALAAKYILDKGLASLVGTDLHHERHLVALQSAENQRGFNKYVKGLGIRNGELGGGREEVVS